MHCWPKLAVVRRRDTPLFGTLGGIPHNDCWSQKRKPITQGVGRKRMKNYSSPHLNPHCQTAQYHNPHAERAL